MTERPDGDFGELSRDDFGATLTFDLSRPGRIGCTLPALDVPEASPPPAELLREELSLPELSQLEVVRYFTVSRSATTASIPAPTRWGAAR